MDHVVRGNHPSSYGWALLMPGLPIERNSVPFRGALLRDHLVNNVFGMDTATVGIENVALFIIQNSELCAVRSDHFGSSRMQDLGRHRKMWGIPGLRLVSGK